MTVWNGLEAAGELAAVEMGVIFLDG